MTQSVPIVPPQRKGSVSGAAGGSFGANGAAGGSVRSGRRVSVSGDKMHNASGISDRGTPTFSPYPQSLPTAHMLKKDGSSDGSGKEGGPVTMIGPGGQQIKKKSRRPSESAAVLCQHCGKNYKHQQCLVKHLWEHSPYWQSIPDNQPLSKHQRVQLLEGASILYRLSGSPGGASDAGVASVIGVPSSSLPDGSLTASGFAGPPGLSPSPFGTSISRSGIVDTRAGIILEDDDDDDHVIASDDEDDSNSPGISSSAIDDDGRQDDEPELFGSMEQ